jgi:Cyclin, N-terminal domain/Cyclin, C-terminal domain
MKDASLSAPLLGIRMKAGSSSSSPPELVHHQHLRGEMDHDVVLDMLAAMTCREQTYKCGDYLTRQRQQQLAKTARTPRTPCSCTSYSESNEVLSCSATVASSFSTTSSTSSSTSSLPQKGQHETAALVDATCREKMCEWSYRVCDHFHTPREIVAFSMSFLDRFVDRRYSSNSGHCTAAAAAAAAGCDFDRTGFKLAAMTTLYLATKVFNGKQISIGTLAELSRGEFEVAHIAEMERVILATLDFRLSPPTIQAFIGFFIQLIPVTSNHHEGNDNDDDKLTARREIYQRAIFFAELCAYDYSLIRHNRSLLAVAAILNAMEGGGDDDMLEDPIMAEDMRVDFIESVNRLDVPLLHIDEHDDDCLEQLESTQARLWYLYSCSAQEQAEGIHPCGSSSSSSHHKRVIGRHHHHIKGDSHHSHSPVSVIAATTST